MWKNVFKIPSILIPLSLYLKLRIILLFCIFFCLHFVISLLFFNLPSRTQKLWDKKHFCRCLQKAHSWHFLLLSVAQFLFKKHFKNMQIKQQHLPFDYWGPRQLKYHQPSLHLHSHTLGAVWSFSQKSKLNFANWIRANGISQSNAHEKGEKVLVFCECALQPKSLMLSLWNTAGTRYLSVRS